MEEPASSSGKNCSWCGTLNSASDTACSKCGAVFSSIQQPVAAIPTNPEVTSPKRAEGSRPSDQDVVSALVDSSFFDKMSGEAMRSLGLGPTFVSGQTIAFLVAGCLSLYILISLAGAAADISRIELLSKPTAGLRIPPPEVTVNLALTILIRLSLIGITLLTAVFFLIWIYRAHKNLKALGATDLKYSPGWAIGGFFVPLLNIVRPYQVMAEIWRASVSGGRVSGGSGWTYEQTPVFIGLWWGLWLISGFLDSFSVFMVFGTGADNRLLVASRFRLVYAVISIASAALAITVVLRTNARQEDANRVQTVAFH